MAEPDWVVWLLQTKGSDRPITLSAAHDLRRWYDLETPPCRRCKGRGSIGYVTPKHGGPFLVWCPVCNPHGQQ